MLLTKGPRYASVAMLTTLQLEHLPDTEAGCSIGQPAGCAVLHCSCWTASGLVGLTPRLYEHR